MYKQITIIKRDKCDRMCLYKMVALEKETLSLNQEMERERVSEGESCRKKVTFPEAGECIG